MKGLLVFLLSFVLLFAPTAYGAPASAQEQNLKTQPSASSSAVLEDEVPPQPPSDVAFSEYERALWYGFAQEQEDASRNISKAEFSEMLSKLVAAYRPDSLSQFESVELISEADESPVYRFYAAIMLLYAGEAMDCVSIPDGNMPTLTPNTIDWDRFWAMDWEQTGLSEENFSQTSQAMTKAWYYDNEPMSYFHGGINFAGSRLSRASGLPLLDVNDSEYMRTMDYLTYQEAAVATVRLYESNIEIVEKLPENQATTLAAEIAIADADARRTKILSTATEATYTGTAYYIANSGDDTADGLSPETAWATIARLNEAKLQPGDAVFFRRNDTWRAETIETSSGITYSAYGEGKKPMLMGSPENGAEASKWSLLEGTDNIWVYYRDMLDCGTLVLDESVGTYKVLGYWDGTKYLNYLGPDDKTLGDNFSLEQQLAEPEFDVREQLDHDLSFFSDASSELPDSEPCYIGGSAAEIQYMLTTKGPLYFRCDAGNPGEVYESIEFITPCPIIDSLAEGCTVDNLFIGFTSNGIAMNGDNTTVRNCEMAWIGGCVYSYSFEKRTASAVGALRMGDALTTAAKNVSITNNYIHEVYEVGIGIEAFRGRLDQGDFSTENVLIRDNLIYHAGGALSYCNWDEEPDPDHMLKNILFENNYALLSGMNDWASKNTALSIAIEGGPNLQERCAFRNNVLLGSRDCMIFINQFHPDTLPDFEGNQYIQYTGYPVLLLREAGEKYSGKDAEELLRNFPGDESGAYVPLKSMKWNVFDW